MERSASPHTLPPKLALRPPSSSAITDGSPPLTRDSSPSPSISPTPALFACPPLSRSFSANSYSGYSSSTASTISQPSVVSRSSSASAAQRQRGYVRPQGVAFAPSAGNRDSVLSLGSIAHLQYYFARTGLLDGKGAQLAKDERGKPGVGKFIPNGAPRIRTSSGGDLEAFQNEDAALDDAEMPEEPVMLPPTVSTYSHRTPFVAPPPDFESLRRDLIAALNDARLALQQASAEAKEKPLPSYPGDEVSQAQPKSPDHIDQLDIDQGHTDKFTSWNEIQGLHILDVVTLAIRAAKLFYTAHEKPQRLYSIKSERKIREELLSTMDVLKKLAGRQFVGGIRVEEIAVITSWVNGIDECLAKEQALENEEAQQRAAWTWLRGSWQDREREREWRFLSSFHLGDSLPAWTPLDPNDPRPTPFHDSLRTGLHLVQIHNALLKTSKRQFGEIKTFHTDLAKPYRCAENLRYWIKAAEIRWETKLQVNVSGVVNCKAEAFPGFDAAIFQWCQAVRSELTKEWDENDSTPQLSLGDFGP